MTFLELVQRLRQEAGIPGTGPTSVVDQAGQLKRLVDWVARSWADIQGMHDNWMFLRNEFSFSLGVGVDVVTPTGAAPGGAALSDFRYWHPDTLRIYDPAVGVADEQWLVSWSYDTFRDTYRFGQQTPGRPVVFAQRPRDRALMFGPVTDVAMTVTGEYQRKPVILTTDADVPEIEDDLAMVIVWHALKKYARFEAAPESLIQATSEYSTLIARLEREQLPDVTLGNPLA